MSADRPMRKFIIAGTYAQYRDWLVAQKASPMAAPYVCDPRKLRGLDVGEDQLVLVGTYWDNPAYMSPEYLRITSGSLPSAIAV